MAKTRFSNPIMVGDNMSSQQPAAVAAEFANPVLSGVARVPVSGQAVSIYYLPTNAYVVSALIDVTTAWATGAINFGSTSNGTELGTFTVSTSTGRIGETVTGPQATARAASTLGLGQVPVYIGNTASSGAGVGVATLTIGYLNFGNLD